MAHRAQNYRVTCSVLLARRVLLPDLKIRRVPRGSAAGRCRPSPLGRGRGSAKAGSERRRRRWWWRRPLPGGARRWPWRSPSPAAAAPATPAAPAPPPSPSRSAGARREGRESRLLRPSRRAAPCRAAPGVALKWRPAPHTAAPASVPAPARAAAGARPGKAALEPGRWTRSVSSFWARSEL